MKNVIILNDTSNELHYGCDLVIKNIFEKNNYNLINQNNILFVKDNIYSNNK